MIKIRFITVIALAERADAKCDGGAAGLSKRLGGKLAGPFVYWVCMSLDDVDAVLGELIRQRLSISGADPDVAVADMNRGLLAVCPWLDVIETPTGREAVVAGSGAGYVDDEEEMTHSPHQRHRPTPRASIEDEISSIVQANRSLSQEIEAVETSLRHTLSSEGRRAKYPYIGMGSVGIHAEKNEVWLALGRAEIDGAEALRRHLELLDRYYT
jgi:hypothetical protein